MNMKKLSIITLAAIFAGLSAFASTPNLRNRADSLNFAFGLLQGELIKTYYLSDSETFNESLQSLMRGIEKGMRVSAEHAELVEIGTNIGHNLRAQQETGLMGVTGFPVNIDLIRQGLINGIFEFDQMTANEAQVFVNTALPRLQRGVGETFLAQNRTQANVHETASGLQYVILREGHGAKPSATDVVRVHYEGRLLDGTIFDSSIQRGEPIAFPLNQVIAGWTEGVQLMPVGSKFRFYIPYHLAYGERGAGRLIPPFATLIFDVELLEIE